MNIYASIFTLINIVLLTAIIVVIVLLIILAIRALLKYLHTKTEDVQPQENYAASPVKKPLGEILKDYRVNNNMTQEYVAEKLNITRQAVSKWEAGQTSPTMANLIALAKLYNIAVEDLLKNMEY